jgi:hypothetical protein
MNNHAATYNPSGKPGARGKGAIGQTTNLQAKAMRMCRERGGDSPLGSLSPPLPPPPPPPPPPAPPGLPHREKRKTTGIAAQWREGDEADVGWNRDEDAGRRERG